MRRVEKLKANKHYVFLVLSLVLALYGLYAFFNQEVQTCHFSSISLPVKPEEPLRTTAFIQGQYKTIGEGFFVGKRISISLLLYLNDTLVYNEVRDSPAFDLVIVKNSERPEHAREDISGSIQKGEIIGTGVGPGALRLTRCHDDKKTVIYEGDVVFTKEGQIAFGQPLEFLMDKYHLQIEGISIAPSHVKYQIRSNRLMLLLSFMALSIACLSLFIGFSRRPRV